MGENGFSADYNVYKTRIAELCEALDEYVLLAGNSLFQSIVEEGDNYLVKFGEDAMRFLRSDTLVLPIVNATVEEFSFYLLTQLQAASEGEGLHEIEVCVASGPGQKGCAIWRAAD